MGENYQTERTILLVDDVRLFLEIQKEFLQNSSVHVMTARNGVDALDASNNKRPDLIFMDLEMPEMNGIDCCRAIKSDPRSAGIPVVMITGRGDEASLVDCRAAGCNDLLTKPLNRNLFLETAVRFVRSVDRREKRSRLEAAGELRFRGRNFPCTLRDLSVGGAFITPGEDFQGEVGRVIQIAFTLPNGSPVECQGTVVWQEKPAAGLPRGFGVSFVLLPQGTKDALTSYLKTAR
jgi:CheY-like chemotaxis protein